MGCFIATMVDVTKT